MSVCRWPKKEVGGVEMRASGRFDGYSEAIPALFDSAFTLTVPWPF